MRLIFFAILAALTLTASLAKAQTNDKDNDGYDSIANGGKDCYDLDPNTHPGAVDICGDGVDQDCFDGDAVCPTPVVNKDTSAKIEVTCLNPKNGKPFNGCEVHIYHWSYQQFDTDSYGESLDGKSFKKNLTPEEACGWDQIQIKTRLRNGGKWYGDKGAPLMQNSVRVTINGKTVNQPGKKGPHLSLEKSPSTNNEGNFVIKAKDINVCNPTDESTNPEDRMCWTANRGYELVITTVEYSGKNAAYNTLTRRGKFCQPLNDGKNYQVNARRIAADNTATSRRTSRKSGPANARPRQLSF